MNKFSKLLGTVFAVTSMSFLATSAQAVCPVCTVAVGAGLGLSRYFGIDDTISGLWIGGLILSSSFWTSDWLQKRHFRIQGKLLDFLVSIIFLIMVIGPLWYSEIIGHPFNTVSLNLTPWTEVPSIFRLDKLIFGTFVGMAIFLLAVALDKKVRKIFGHQLFIYQKVVFPIASLILTSLVFYLVLFK
jgi:hypothetical protein